MKAEIIGTEDGIIGVQVIDPRGNIHLVEIDVKNEDTEDLHAQESYPNDPSERTAEQNQIMYQVRARARYEAHITTEYNILLPDWDPRQLHRGIEGLENMSLKAFGNAFRDYYYALINSEKAKEEYEITEGSVEFTGEPHIVLIMKGFCIDEQNEVVNVLPDMYIYYTNDQTEQTYTAGTSASCSDETTQLTVMLPPFVSISDDFNYPEDFRASVINNLVCQIRDIYRNMGEKPPANVDLEGFGKPAGNFDPDEF